MTDLRDQLWCEKQLEFGLLHGREETPAMREGSTRHEELHEEITEVVAVSPRSREDHWAFYLFNAMAGLQLLSQKGLCRELPVFGTIEKTWLLGVLDQLELTPAGTLLLSDTKTRQRPSLPSAPQKQTSRLQLMLYRRLFEQLRRRALTAEDFFDHLDVDPTRPLTPDFALQMQELGLLGNRLEEILPLALAAFQEAPGTDSELVVRYEWQEAQTPLGEDRFPYRESWLQKQVQQSLEFWRGQRVARGVPYRERWKCRYCSFQEKCPVKPGP